MYQLYTATKSRGIRVVWALEEIGAEYELKIHTPRDAAVKELNPGRKIPILKDDDFVITESAAICTYLADQHPQTRLAPTPGTRDRAHFDEWNYFVMTDIEPPLWNYAKNAYLYPEKLRVAEILPACRREFSRSIDTFGQKLGEREFLMGDEFTIADILCGHTLSWARGAKFEIDADNVNGYADRVLARDALSRARVRDTQASDMVASQ